MSKVIKIALVLLLLLAHTLHAQVIEEFTLDSKNPTALIELPFNDPQVHVPELLNAEQIKCIETTIGSNPKDSTYSSVLIELNPLCQFLGKAKIKITNPKDSKTINQPLEYIISIPFKPDVLIVSNAEKLTPDVNFYDALQKYLMQVTRLGLSYKYLEIGGRKGSYKFDSDEYSLVNFNYQPQPLTLQELNTQVSGFVRISEPKILLILGGYSFILPRAIRNEEKLTAGFDLNFTIENICGDSICSNSEKSKGNCCIDCACLTGKVCNFEKKTCQTTIPPFSKQKQNEIITKYTQNNQDYVNYTYNSSFDSTYNSQSVRVIVLACNLNQTEPCFAYLVVNNQGNVISAYSTN